MCRAFIVFAVWRAWENADGLNATIMNPFKTWRAAKFLIKGPLILGLLTVINVMTSPHHWWVQWAALGIGIVWIVSLFRVLKAMILLGGFAALIAFLSNQYRNRANRVA